MTARRSWKARRLRIACVAAMAWSQSARSDSIDLASGESVRGTVRAITASGIEVDVDGKQVRLSADGILDVRLDALPPAIAEGDAAMEKGDFEAAARSYRTGIQTAAAGSGKEVRLPILRWKLVTALRARRKNDEALRELEKLREEAAGSFLTVRAYRAALDISRQSRDDRGFTDLLGKMTRAGGKAAEWAVVEKGRTDVEAGRAAQAVKDLEPLTRSEDVALAEAATIWSLRALRSAGDGEKLSALARSSLEKLSNGSPALIQAARAAEGSALFTRAGKDRSILRQAALESLRALAAGPPSREEPPDDHALAAITAARAYSALAGLSSSAEAAGAMRQRATRYYRDVIDTYAHTAWAAPAREELSKLSQGATPAR